MNWLVIFASVLGVCAAQFGAPRPAPKVCSDLIDDFNKEDTDTTRRRCLKSSPRLKKLFVVKNTHVDWEDVTTNSFIARWDPVPNADCYYIEILFGYTIFVKCFEPCYKSTEFEMKKLPPASVWGIKVSAVDRDGKCGDPGIPARTRTVWAPTTPTTTKAYPTITPEPKECGKRFFTCHSNRSECIPNRKWCDRQLNCVDGSDERGCPGGCEELDIDFRNGNYSCSRYGSPGSTCFFDCDKNYIRDGKWYTRCSRYKKKWSNPIPTCRLSFSKSVRVVDSTNVSVTVEWEPVSGATGYTFIAVQRLSEGSKAVPLKRAQSFGSDTCCKAEITKLIPDSEFKITVRATDRDDVDGVESMSVYGRTETSYDIDIEESHEMSEEKGE